MRFLYIALILLIFTSCSESILSDMEINDPNMLKVKVKIEQSDYNEKEIQVFVRDTKDHPVDMLDGRVYVNNHRVSYDRAEINSLGARGYIYTPHSNEQIFEITIYWNHYESHTFTLSPSNGWPGFYTDDNCSCYHSHDHFVRRNYTLKPAPFNDREIEVSYHILSN